MEDNKKDELKEVMGQSFSQEEIEKRLKEQIKNASKTREQFNKKRETITQKNILNNKKPLFERLSFNSLLIGLLAVAAILIFVTIYLFNKQESNNFVKPNKKDDEKKYFNQMYNSKNYDTFKCYSYVDGKISLPLKECKESLDKFLNKNKHANRFEIVPLVSDSDSVIYNDIEKDLVNKPEKMQKKIKEYLNIGLSSERILESVWYIKKILGEATIVTSSQYYVKSENKDEKGVIIRAYH